jgi:hypothetical protein
MMDPRAEEADSSSDVNLVTLVDSPNTRIFASYSIETHA